MGVQDDLFRAVVDDGDGPGQADASPQHLVLDYLLARLPVHRRVAAKGCCEWGRVIFSVTISVSRDSES